MSARQISLLLTENLFSAAQFTDAAGTALHTITGQEEATGHEAKKAANGRRSAADYWAPTTPAAARYLRAAFDQVRAFNCLVIDRGHNIGGFVATLETTMDAFTTTSTVIAPTIPTVSGPAHIDDGALTEEGAYIQRFPLTAGDGVQLDIAALGAGVVQNIVGLWVGLAFEFPHPIDDVQAVMPTEIVSRISYSDRGWRGMSEVTQRHTDTVRLRLDHPIEASQLRYHLGHFDAGYPCWWVYDIQQADRAMCIVKADQGPTRLEYRPEWWNRPQVTLSFQEHEPR